MADSSLPIEVGLEQARREMVDAVNRIGTKYNLPSSIVVLVLEKMVYESKLNTFETLVSYANIEIPSPTSQPLPQQPKPKKIVKEAPIAKQEGTTPKTEPKSK